MRNTRSVWQLLLPISILAIAGLASLAGCAATGADMTAPTVTATAPLDLATDVPVNADIIAHFSAAMDPATITDTTFTLEQGSTAVAGAVSYAGATATFDPAVELAYGTEYTASISSEATDISGNSLLAHTWSFITALEQTDFEALELGSVNGQDGWSMTGTFDVEVVENSYGYAEFGAQSLRISNAITSSGYTEQTYSRSLENEAGESSAESTLYSGGIRQEYFEAAWDFASTVPGSEQPGLSVTANPDRGDGARMSYLQMLDTPTGLQLNFYDYQHSVLNFVLTPIATAIDRTIPHAVKITMHFVEGPANDVVKVYLDGSLVHAGTSWEDYFRDVEEVTTHTVDSILFRLSGTAAPLNSGNGFLIDNFVSYSGPFIPEAAE